ncbi:hypothetical protein TIFTF001_000557 [Ficus carica]|uniref:Uncharacterized protein n=1 Tax=Ficus carica TaxID=3494 RepID=A0AA87Z398_FICCA|nr:hypothetical protein TIFTF001_000557 [Ficus carica]
MQPAKEELQRVPFALARNGLAAGCSALNRCCIAAARPQRA